MCVMWFLPLLLLLVFLCWFKLARIYSRQNKVTMNGCEFIMLLSSVSLIAFPSFPLLFFSSLLFFTPVVTYSSVD